MEFLFYSLMFYFGAVIGSFLNVVAVRHNTGMGVAKGRSLCFSCSHKLSWYDLIPLVSFIVLRARCRYCKSKISWQYPTVEIISGMIFLGISLKVFTGFPFITLGEIFHFGYYSIVFSILIIIGIYDFRHKIIPNRFVYGLSVLSLFVAFGIVGTTSLSFWSILAGPLLALPLALLWIVSSGRWLGLGDAKLVLGMGWLLGISSGAAAVLISFWLGAIVGLALLALSRLRGLLQTMLPRWSQGNYTIKSEIPFGPFLIAGTLTVFFYEITFADVQAFLTF